MPKGYFLRILPKKSGKRASGVRSSSSAHRSRSNRTQGSADSPAPTLAEVGGRTHVSFSKTRCFPQKKRTESNNRNGMDGHDVGRAVEFLFAKLNYKRGTV